MGLAAEAGRERAHRNCGEVADLRLGASDEHLLGEEGERARRRHRQVVDGQRVLVERVLRLRVRVAHHGGAAAEIGRREYQARGLRPVSRWPRLQRPRQLHRACVETAGKSEPHPLIQPACDGRHELRSGRCRPGRDGHVEEVLALLELRVHAVDRLQALDRGGTGIDPMRTGDAGRPQRLHREVDSELLER